MSPTENLLEMIRVRLAMRNAWEAETGLRPSQTQLCQRVDELGVMRTWFEPKTINPPWTYVLFGEALEECRQKDSDQRIIGTQRALLTFARHSEMPGKFVDEAANNLTIINYPK